MCQKCIDEIELMLKNASKKKHSSPQAELAWQRGYLTALLANYMHEDANIHRDIAHRKKSGPA